MRTGRRLTVIVFPIKQSAEYVYSKMKKNLEIVIPNPERRRALLVVDVQTGFLDKRNKWIVSNIQKVLTQGAYTTVVEAIFYAEQGSLWEKQIQWTFPLQPTVQEIKELLPENTLTITKTTKSVFKGD